jgi:hypothetical protein
MSPLAKAADPRHPEANPGNGEPGHDDSNEANDADHSGVYDSPAAKAPAHGAFPTLARIRLPFAPEYLPAGHTLGLSKLVLTHIS